jgi:hypothetical protein
MKGNTMPETLESPYRFAQLGTEAYQAGFNRQAADLFVRGRETALEQGNVRAQVHSLRWTGNALMWAGRFEDACHHLLHAISFDEHAEADIEDVYGAMTDLCLLSTRCRSYPVLQQMLADTRAFLARRARERWGHRLDLIQAIAHLRRHEFPDAYALGNRAWQQMRAVHNGPRYHNNSYLNYIFRAAHGAGDAVAMDAALEEMQRHGEHSIQTCRVRDHICGAIRLAFDGVTEFNREQIDFHVQDAHGARAGSDSVGDEITHALRLLAILGRWPEASGRLSRVSNAEPAFGTLLQIDLTICRLAAGVGWTVPFYAKHMADEMPPRALLADSEAELSEVQAQWRRAVQAAKAEDARMNCSANTEALALRRRWLIGDSATNEELFANTLQFRA